MKYKAIFIFLFLFSILAKSQSVEIEKNNHAFKAGEKSQYDLYYNWGFIWIDAAKVDFTVKEKRYNGNPVYELEMASATVTNFSKFMIHDTLKSYVNRETLIPYYFVESNYEDNYFAKNKFKYFQTSTKWGVFIEKDRRKEIRRDTLISEKSFFDVISTVYRFRSMDARKLKPNEKIPMTMVFEDGIYNLYLRYLGKEQIKLHNGKRYNCLKIKPYLAEGKMFNQGEGMTVWISDDDNHIPLMVESKMKIGSIKAMLNNVENNRFLMSSEIKEK